MHQLITPTRACHRLRHRTETRAKQPGPGRYEYCVVCTFGYEMAMAQYGGDQTRADAFVQDLRHHA